jgi:hypothetical protein
VSGFVLVSYVVLWILVVLLSVAVFALYHYFGQVYLNSREGRENQGPESGKPFPHTVASDLRNGRAPLVRRLPAAVAFMDVECKLCAELLPDLGAFADDANDVGVVAVVAGRPPSVSEFTRRLSKRVDVFPDPRGALGTGYGVAVLPFLVTVDGEGIVRAKGIVNDRDDLERIAGGIRERARVVEPVLEEVS